MAQQISFEKFYNIVNGEQRGASKTAHGIDPVTGEPNWEVPVASQSDLDDAVKAGKVAFKSWSATPEKERHAKMHEFLKIFKAKEKEFTDLLCKETGKPRFWASQEVQGSAAWLGYPNTVELPVDVEEDETKIIKTSWKPLGVVGAITPWNFPMLLGAGKLGPALATGNTIIIKPSPFTPYTMLKIVELMQTVYPPGVVQVLGGDDSLGPMIVSHPDIAKITFTGSVAAGKKIMASCANTLKRVTLELGGNDVAIVMPDADIEAMAPDVALGAFQTSGQVCIATKRIYVHESIYKQFLQKMAQFTNKLVVGASDEEGVMMGPVQNKSQHERVAELLADAAAKDYKFATSAAPDGHGKSKGFFFNPTIVDNPPDDSRVVVEEPFGPVVPVQSWKTEDEVIARANNSENGLGGSVWGTNLEKAEAIADRLETGTVWINTMPAPSPAVYFPAHKQSGIGGEWGRQGKLAYCNAQVKWIPKKPSYFTKMAGLN